MQQHSVTVGCTVALQEGPVCRQGEKVFRRRRYRRSHINRPKCSWGWVVGTILA